MILYDGFKFLSHLEMTVFSFMFTYMYVRVILQKRQWKIVFTNLLKYSVLRNVLCLAVCLTLAQALVM